MADEKVKPTTQEKVEQKVDKPSNQEAIKQPPTPIEIFNDIYNHVDTMYNQLGLTEVQWHKIIECRAANQQLMSQLNYIHPVERVKLHDKISKSSFWSLRLGY